ncbi:MAG TPA: hypothetical protein VGD23_05715 [Sphingomicrobium sp.]
MATDPAFLPTAERTAEDAEAAEGVASLGNHGPLTFASVASALLAGAIICPLVVALAIATSRWASPGGYFTMSWADAVWGVPIAFLLLAIGAPLIAIFWNRAPFGWLSCSIVGVVCGGVAFYVIGLGLDDPDDYAWFEAEGMLFEYHLGIVKMIALGSLAGLAGGLTFWRISRLRLRQST